MKPLKALCLTISLILSSNICFAKSLDVKNFEEKTYQSATKNLTAIEEAINEGRLGDAINQAEQSLASIRSAVGINPRVAAYETIPVDINLDDNWVRVPLMQFPEQYDLKIKMTLANYKQGRYLDLINLYKRTNVMYAKAIFERTKGEGERESDKELIRERLMDAYLFPIYVKFSNASTSYLLFHYEIAHDDFGYFFDREIVDTFSILGETEQSLEQEIIDAAKRKKEAHWKRLPQQVSSNAPECQLGSDDDHFNGLLNGSRFSDSYSLIRSLKNALQDDICQIKRKTKCTTGGYEDGYFTIVLDSNGKVIGPKFGLPNHAFSYINKLRQIGYCE